jgi:FkbM family methyltransferase
MLKPDGVNTISQNPHFEKSVLSKYFENESVDFIDIGARGGVHDIVDPIASITNVIAFEPNLVECSRLLKLKGLTENWKSFQMLPVGLFKDQRSMELYLYSEPNNNSLYEPNDCIINRYNMEKFRVVDSIPAQLNSLDILCSSHVVTPLKTRGDVIKLDVQGAEYDVLEGSSFFLKSKTSVVICEISFCKVYKNQKLFSDIEILLRKNGFSFYGFGPQHTRSKKLLDKKNSKTAERLLYADAYFFRDPFDLHINKYAEGLIDVKRNARVVFLFSLLLGYFDFSYELVLNCSNLELNKNTDNEKFLIQSLSDLPPEISAKELKKLQKSVEIDESLANIKIGEFIGSRKLFSDYDDVLNISPLPKTI